MATTKTILVDAVDCFIVEDNGNFRIFKKMLDVLETLPKPEKRPESS